MGTYHLLYAILEVFKKNFSCHLKYCLHILTSLGGCFDKEGDFATFLKFSGLSHLDRSISLLVLHISDQYYDNFRVTLRNDFLMPAIETVKCISSRDIIGQQYAVGSLIKYLGYRFE